MDSPVLRRATAQGRGEEQAWGWVGSRAFYVDVGTHRRDEECAPLATCCGRVGEGGDDGGEGVGVQELFAREVDVLAG